MQYAQPSNNRALQTKLVSSLLCGRGRGQQTTGDQDGELLLKQDYDYFIQRDKNMRSSCVQPGYTSQKRAVLLKRNMHWRWFRKMEAKQSVWVK